MRQKLFLLLSVLLVLLCGCGNQNNVPEEPAPAEESEVQDSKDYEFIFVCTIPENAYWKTCIKGMHMADAELGTHTRVLGPEQADNFAVEIVKYMEEAIAARPDGILAYAGIEALFPLIEQATELGIPVLALDSDAPDTSRVAYIGTDAYNAGYKAGQKMVELTGGAVKVGVMISSMSAEKEVRELEAFRNAVEDYDIEIVAIEETDVNPDVAERKTRKMLREHPEISAIFNTSADNVTSAARVKKELELNDLVLIGFDDVEENLKFVREGVIDAIFVQRIEQVGYQGVHLMRDYLVHGELPQENYDTGTILVTQENVDSYSFSAMDVGKESKTVRVGYYTGETALQDGFADGQRKTGYAYEYYQAVAALTGWKYEYTYGSRTEMIDRLLTGDVDIIAGIYQTDVRAEQMLFPVRDMGISGEKRYFALNKDRTDLLSDLNYALEELTQTYPALTVGLREQYYGSANVQQIFTDCEREWLAGREKLRMGYIRHNLPISGQAADGTPIGLIQTLTENFSDYLQLEIEPVCYENTRLMEEGLKAGEIDAAFPMYSDVWLSETKGFRQTKAFFDDRVMVVYQGNYTDDLMDKVALSQTGIGMRNYIAAYYPNSQITFYDSREEAFDAILAGRESCVLGCSSVLQRFMAEHSKYQNMHIAYLDIAENFGISVRQDDSLLAGILNKAVSHIDETVITGALIEYSAAEAPYTIAEFVRRNFQLVVALLLVFFAVLAGVFYEYSRRTRIFNAEQAQAQASLEKALEAANAASEAKTNFLSSMSHDIRTPMNAIVGMSVLASKNLDDRGKVEDCLEKITISSHHLLTLINNVLDISKIESGKLALNPSDFSLRGLVAAMENIVRPQLVGKGQELNVQMDDLPYDAVYADELRVNQVFINLLTNAVKYTPTGGKIILGLREEVLADDRVKLIYTVKDNGIGMSREFMDNMYELFTRAKDSRIDKIQGTGLGLSIVKQIVDMMGGTIECQSEEGKGTTFTVTLEMLIGKEMDEEKQEVLSEDALNDLHLLIAEDNDLNWEIIEQLLDMHHITADRAEDGQICVDKAVSAAPGTYDLILMDVQMPVMNGKDAARAIRANEWDHVRTIPIIAMTADAFAEDIASCMEAGMDGHVSKPVDMEKLLQEIQKVMMGKNRRGKSL